MKLARAIFFSSIVIAGLYYSYPGELSSGEKLSIFTAYITTLELTIFGLLIGIIVGFGLSFIRTLDSKIANFFIEEYVDLIRGTPVLLQLMIFAFVIFVAFPDNFFAGVIALGLNSSAYVTEIVRSGLNSVDKGQYEAARSMGLSHIASMCYIIYPQAIKNILPALGNEFIMLFKETSVVGLIGIADLTMRAKSLQAVLYSPEPLIFVGIIYYVNVRILSFLVKKWEEKLK